ncbi:MAG: hypothetical protein WC197_01340 [Candidatus Gastranaerophilaceae bacterium]
MSVTFGAKVIFQSTRLTNHGLWDVADKIDRQFKDANNTSFVALPDKNGIKRLGFVTDSDARLINATIVSDLSANHKKQIPEEYMKDATTINLDA